MRGNPFAGRKSRPPRHVLRTQCHVIRLRDLRIVADRLEDFSEEGLLVGPSEPVLTGEPILVFLRFPDTDDWLDTTGVVARVVHGRRPGEWSRNLGIELDFGDALARRILERNLSRRPPAPPRSRPGRRGASPASLSRLTAAMPMLIS